MTGRENLIAALEGEQPERIPYTIYEDFMPKDPLWEEFLDWGMVMVPSAPTVRRTLNDQVQQLVTNETYQGRPAMRVTYRTPLGEISEISVDNWTQEPFLKTREDYRVLEYVIRNTRVEFNPLRFLETEARVGERGLTMNHAPRTPLQAILVEYAGVEQFAYHLAEGFPELFAVAEALMDNLVRACELIAQGPGRYVNITENLSGDLWGPQRYLDYHVKAYKRILPILHGGGKKVYTHYDGKLSCLKKPIAKTAIDGLESLTTPPEGDMSYAECRAAWPDKFFWANINLSHYSLPPAQLREKVRELAQEAAPDGRLLAFSISEQCPDNWKAAVPVVLDALDELADSA
jgi:hypothetical protein